MKIILMVALFSILPSLAEPSLPISYMRAEDLPCQEESTACYAKNLTALQANSRYKEVFYYKNSRYVLPKSRSKYVFIFLHALWTNERHMGPISSFIISQYPDAAAITITLPGHDEEAINKKIDATYQDWLQAVDDTVALSKLFGDKIILVGESLGSVLATYASLKYPDIVAAQILFEPAFKLNPPIESLACFSKNLIADALPLAQFAQIPLLFRDRFSLKMACEVPKLSNAFFRKFSKLQCSPEQNYNCSMADASDMANVASQISAPTLLVNNVKDLAVNPYTNSWLSKQSSKITLLNFNEGGIDPHGGAIFTLDRYLKIKIENFLNTNIH